MNLSRTLAPGKNSVNMVDWKYSGFFSLIWITGLISRIPIPATKFLEGGLRLRSDWTIRRLQRALYAQSKARHSLAKVPPLLRGPPALLQGTPISVTLGQVIREMEYRGSISARRSDYQHKT